MTYTVVPDKTVGDPFTEQMWDTYIRDNLNKGVMRPIAETVLGSAAASITFSSIAADFRHLLLVVYARIVGSSTAEALNLRLNADSTANYQWAGMRSLGATQSNISAANATWGRVGDTAGDATQSQFCTTAILIPGYSNSIQKCFTSWCGGFLSGTPAAFAAHYGGTWQTTAITSVAIHPGSSTLSVGTIATLYGLGLL